MPAALSPTLGRLPRAPGVYRFRDATGRILYLGRATDLRSRVRSYWGSLAGRGRLAVMMARVARVEAVACASVHEAAWLERNLLEASMPRWNRTPGGQETPTYIVVDGRPRTPGIRLAHASSSVDGARSFGPYLGGVRTQLAISGLHRLFPLAYAGERLTAAERDMASKRGIGPADRDRLVAAAVGVLERLGRDRTGLAVARAGLESARDRASAALGFELAARIHDEISALDWVTSEQRVTIDGGGDGQACGWHEGMSVQFTMRDGRIVSWQQRSCSLRVAAPLMAATPSGLAGFATESARLAAVLAQT